MESHVPRSIRNIDPSKGLHRLKRDFQKKFRAQQCKQLVARLDEAIAATFKDAPVRERAYLIDRTKVQENSAGAEAKIERALHRQWGTPECGPAVGCWQWLAAFQVNLPNKKQAEGWGEIDLVGVADDGLPLSSS